MFDPNQISDYEYEDAMDSVLENSEEEWPDDLYDECGFDPYEGAYTFDC